MARYTVELRELMRNEEVMPLITEALSKYPMYTPQSDDEEVRAIIPTREELNRKLLNHYKYREIGFETVGRFLDELERAMDEIMPYYNQMYNSVEIMALIDDPFGNVDVTENYTETRSGTGKVTGSGSSTTSATDSSSTNSSGSSHSKNLESETPQVNIAKTAEQIDDVSHADKASWSKNGSSENTSSEGESSSSGTNTSESESETNETIEHTFTKRGNQGVNTYAHDMVEFRTSIIDVTMQIIEDKKISELFMLVY